MHQDPDGPCREQSKAAKGSQKRPRSAGAAPYDSRLRLPRLPESRITDHGRFLSCRHSYRDLGSPPRPFPGSRPGPQLGRSQNLAKLCQPSVLRQPSSPLGGPKGNMTKPTREQVSSGIRPRAYGLAAPLASPAAWRKMQVSRRPPVRSAPESARSPGGRMLGFRCKAEGRRRRPRGPGLRCRRRGHARANRESLRSGREAA